MSDLAGLTLRAVALRVLGDRVSHESAKVKAELAEELIAGDRKTAALGDGRAVGSVTYAKGKATARVTDEAALLRWVVENHPDEIVQSVRGSFLSLLLNDAKANGIAADRATGELVPGIQVTFTEPYLSVRPDPAAIPALVEAIRANQLLALEGVDK